MSYQEKRSLTYLFTNIILFVTYGLIIYNRYQAGGFDTTNLMRFWAIVILIYIPITIVVRIVVTILFVILNTIANEIQGNEQDDVNVVDERDRLIELKTTRIEMIVFASGFLFALLSQVFDQSIHVFFLILIGFGFVTDVFSELMNFRYYRKGV